MSPLIEIQDVRKYYVQKHLFQEPSVLRALDGVSLSLYEGETLAIVGESGCGKTTLAKTLMRIEKPTSGVVRRPEDPMQIQYVFQDPYTSLNPRKRAWQIVAEPLLINSKLSQRSCKLKAVSLLEQVGIRVDLSERYPHMFSGGQRQRIAIARALIVSPKILILDEPVSALDVSIQAQILNLLIELQQNLRVSYILVSHDLSVVRHLADRILVLYLGKVVESGPVEQIFTNPKHPYTRSLLKSVLPLRYGAKRQIEILKGELPSPLERPSGCSFQNRCPLVMERCRREEPLLRSFGPTEVACHID